jgi:RNA recognition motif-containing protein
MLSHPIPQSSNPLQIRPAESNSERENKIFVGMLPKSVSEAGLHDMFSPFGQLKEVIYSLSLSLPSNHSLDPHHPRSGGTIEGMRVCEICRPNGSECGD